jgi:hypothetical protein
MLPSTMQRFLPSRLLPVVALLAAGLLMTACDSNGPTTEPPPEDDDIPVPSSYTFSSRFVDGESAVAYPGQVTRNLLIADLKALTDARATPVTEQRLMDRYMYDSQDLDILLSVTPDPQQTTYPDIATGKSLQGKATAQYSDIPLIGIGAVPGFSAGATADEVVRQYLADIASNYDSGQTAPAAYTTADEIDMGQIVNKLLLGSVAYSQGTAKYLDDVLNRETSPNTQDGDKPYSTLGHVWDEAYGYYGAPRDFNASGVFYDGDGLVAKASDRNGDGAIDLESEFMFTWADYSVDRGTVNDINFHTTLFEAFREGRTAILNQKSIDEIRSHAADARAEWDRLVASNVVHYLNSMKGDLSGLSDDQTITREALGDDTAAALNEHWGEAKPFAWALQYNPDKAISDADLQALHDELGGTPPYGMTRAEALADIDAAKSIIQEAYDFPDANMNNW